MSARDELAKLLGDHYGTSAGKDDYLWSMADIIIERGYTKPRTITTTEELEGLRSGSILIAGSRIYQKDRGALMDLGIGILGYEEVLQECESLLCVHEPTA